MSREVSRNRDHYFGKALDYGVDENGSDLT